MIRSSKLLLLAAVLGLALFSQKSTATDYQIGYTPCVDMLDGTTYCDGVGFIDTGRSPNCPPAPYPSAGSCNQECASSYNSAALTCQRRFYNDPIGEADCESIAQFNFGFCLESCGNYCN
jgi:hypothetical protein